jgi:hypothetical protein
MELVQRKALSAIMRREAALSRTEFSRSSQTASVLRVTRGPLSAVVRRRLASSQARKLAAPLLIGIIVLPIENVLVFLVQIGRESSRCRGGSPSPLAPCCSASPSPMNVGQVKSTASLTGYETDAG